MNDGDNIATGRIEIDLGALVRNFRLLQEYAAPAECAATVKADAYGHGVGYVVPALAQEGCKTFMVATPSEGVAVRALTDDATIYVLDGLLSGQTGLYLKHDLRPVLGSLDELTEWSAATSAPAALHIDTGMNRLGLSPAEVETVIANDSLRTNASLALIMTHLACADEPDHPLNEVQISSFNALRTAFPSIRASLGNSGATITGVASRYDLARPGIALYGGRAIAGQAKPTEPVATVKARILKIRTDWNVGTVGYGATRSLSGISRIATLAIGYADGLPRHLSAADGAPAAQVWCAGQHLPVIGRISMDLTTVDISSLPAGAVRRGDMVEIFGRHIDVDDLAERAGTIGYELLTRLSRRFPRYPVHSTALT